MEFDFKLPGLGRPASSRPQRVAEAVRNELSLLLLRDAGDPRLAGVAISRVVVTPDLLFFFDNRNEEVQRIDDLFRQIEKERNDEPS